MKYQYLGSYFLPQGFLLVVLYIKGSLWERERERCITRPVIEIGFKSFKKNGLKIFRFVNGQIVGEQDFFLKMSLQKKKKLFFLLKLRKN